MTQDIGAPPREGPSPRQAARSADVRGLERVDVQPPLWAYLAETWRRRDLAVALAVADARSAHVDTVLGNAWQLLNPMLLIGVYFLIFDVVFDVSRGLENYLGFLATGVFMFTFLRKTTSSGARAVISNRSLVQNISFPRVLLPIATVLAEFLTFLPSLLVVFVVALATGETASWHWTIVLVAAGLQLVFGLGLAMVVARLTVHFRDVESILPFLLRLWFYMSGVLYPVARIGDALGGFWQTLFEANPGYVYLAIARDGVLDNRIDTDLLLLGVGWALVSLSLGLLYFRRHEARFGNA